MLISKFSANMNFNYELKLLNTLSAYNVVLNISLLEKLSTTFPLK